MPKFTAGKSKKSGRNPRTLTRLREATGQDEDEEWGKKEAAHDFLTILASPWTLTLCISPWTLTLFTFIVWSRNLAALTLVPLSCGLGIDCWLMYKLNGDNDECWSVGSSHFPLYFKLLLCYLWFEHWNAENQEDVQCCWTLTGCMHNMCESFWFMLIPKNVALWIHAFGAILDTFAIWVRSIFWAHNVKYKGKNAYLKIGSKHIQKWWTPKTKRNSNIFGGCWTYKSGLKISVGAPEVPFLGRWKWLLLAKVPQKMALRAPARQC